ncbi:copper-binding protein [Terasakiella sp. SH-1]|uniref:copper-binding protein n=1 Tax=Terasakiella sp. SH-1 TaxID=2560057 RepID=UPI0010736D71|nr:copper-binding protein [Terasakiella sp. SH-1]
MFVKKRLLSFAAAFTLGAVALTSMADAKGYLARKSVELPDLVLGTDEAGYQVSTKEYNLETGKSYALKIISSGRKEYAMTGDDFFNFIWLRKVEAGGMEIKATHLYELEFEDEGEAEIYFVPIKPGKYILKAEGLEAKGTFTTINVK